jgi:lipopolysaccharide export system permease protein
MSIFERYVFRQAAGALMLILSSLSGIVWIALALRQLNVVTSQGQDAWLLLKMTTLALPNLMAIIAPFALLIATIHTLNRLNGDSELIVFTASGATVWTVARPLLLLAVLVAGAVSLVNHLGQPWSLRLLREYLVQVRTDLLSQVIQPGRFSSPEPKLTFHIRERSLNGELLGLVMHDQRDPKLSQAYLAERGNIIKQGSAAYLLMSDGHIVRRLDPQKPADIVAFKTYAIDLNRFEAKDDDSDDLKPRERYFDELVNPERSSALFKRVPGQFRAELHERFANPLYPIAFVLIALAAVGQAQSTRQNRVERVVAAFVVAVAARIAGLALNFVVVLNAAATPLLYALPLAAMAIAGISIRRGARPRRSFGVTDRIVDLLAPVTTPLLRLWQRRRGPAGGVP